MRVNKSEIRVAIDVDETLIQKSPTATLSLDYYGVTVLRSPMMNNINLLKAYKKRGYDVTVHSANGWQWAQEVVMQLGLNEFVDEVATKYEKLVDDRPIEDWARRIFLPESDGQ